MIAVLTGDIVSSQSMPDKRKWLGRLQEIIEKKTGLSKPPKWGVFRGDGFQVEISTPADALRIAIMIRSGLKSASELFETGIDARIGIGIGDKGYIGKSVHESDGEAYLLSGKALDSFNNQYRLQIKTRWPEVDLPMNIALALASAIVDNWTRGEAEAAYIALSEGKTQVEMAKKLGISQPAVHKRVAGAHIRAISDLIEYFDDTISTRSKEKAK